MEEYIKVSSLIETPPFTNDKFFVMWESEEYGEYLFMSGIEIHSQFNESYEYWWLKPINNER